MLENVDTTGESILRQCLTAEMDRLSVFCAQQLIASGFGPRIFCGRLAAEDSNKNRSVAGNQDHVN
jgi:hypothetical protein